MYRVIALGASNLTRGFQAVVSTAREAWGTDVEVIAALGHGRSYGTASWFLGRTLPGILESGLWRHIAALPPAPTRALVTDVGNDIIYGASPPQILAWVDEAVGRLRRVTPDVIVADLPIESIRTLGVTRFLVFRSLLAPQCRLSLQQIVDASEQVSAGLRDVAEAWGVRFAPLDPRWYGLDPIHMRPGTWGSAWAELLCGAQAAAPGAPSVAEWLQLYLMRPARQQLFGVTQVTPQTGRRLSRGGRIWLF